MTKDRKMETDVVSAIAGNGAIKAEFVDGRWLVKKLQPLPIYPVQSLPKHQTENCVPGLYTGEGPGEPLETERFGVPSDSHLKPRTSAQLFYSE
jgi:hypothetical protein